MAGRLSSRCWAPYSSLALTAVLAGLSTLPVARADDNDDDERCHTDIFGTKTCHKVLKLSTGARIGIAVGLAVALLLCIAVYYWRRKRAQKANAAFQAEVGAANFSPQQMAAQAPSTQGPVAPAGPPPPMSYYTGGGAYPQQPYGAPPPNYNAPPQYGGNPFAEQPPQQAGYSTEKPSSPLSARQDGYTELKDVPM